MINNFDVTSFISLPSIKEKCFFLWEHYLSRKFNNDFEPSWTHFSYDLAKRYTEEDPLTEKEAFILTETIKSHCQKDGTEVPVKTGFPNEGSRIMHDCWKAGSFTWIFMGRNQCSDVSKHKNFVIISRTLPDSIYDLIDRDYAPQTLYGAYALDKNVTFGPAIYRDQLLEEIDKI